MTTSRLQAARLAAYRAALSRRNMLGLGLASALAPGLAFGQDFSARPIRILVGSTAAGSIDFAARTIAPALGEILRTSVVIENKPGASGGLAVDTVVRAPADGHTLMVTTPSAVLVAPQAMEKPLFNPLTDLQPVNLISTSPIGIAVNPKLPITNLREMVAFSKTRPLNMALPLAGSVSHLAVEMVAKATGCNFVNVAYKGAAPANNDTIAGHTDVTVSDLGVFIPFHKENRLRIVTHTADKRIDSMPDIGTVAEVAPGFSVVNWMGMFAPANLPKPILDRINAALTQVLAREEVRSAFQRAAVNSANMPSPDAFQKYVASEYQRFGQIVRERKITIS